MTAKPWQIAVIVIGLVFGVGFLGYQVVTASSDGLPHRVTLMDVTTGELFEADTKKTGPVFIPAVHPETGKTTLMRVEEFEPGKWRVSRRDLELLSLVDKSAAVKAFDPKTGDILVSVQEPKKYSPRR